MKLAKTRYEKSLPVHFVLFASEQFIPILSVHFPFSTMRVAPVPLLLSLFLWLVASGATGATSDAASPSPKSPDGLLSDSLPISPALDPTYSYYDLWDHFECNSYFNSPDRPIRHESIWNRAQEAYRHVMTNTKNLSNSSLNEESMLGNSLQVRYSVRPAGEKGLGLFAEERIPKGAIVVDYRRQTAKLKRGDFFRQLVHSTSEMRDVSCTLLQCSAVESYCNERDIFIATYLDDGCLMNHDDEPNIGGLTGDDCLDTLEYEYALRDIEVGEELLCTYEASHLAGWDEFSL